MESRCLHGHPLGSPRNARRGPVRARHDSGCATRLDDFPVNGGAAGGISSEWSAYSLTGGVLARLRLGNGFTLAPALDAGVARLVSFSRAIFVFTSSEIRVCAPDNDVW